jgi:hypothetical protein
MANTRRNLVDAVLDNLGVLVFGQAPSDEMVSRVDGLIDPVFAELAALDIVSISDPGTPNPPSGGNIDDAFFPSLCDYVAFAVAAPFGLGADPALKVLSDQAEETLRRIGRPAKTRKTLTTDIQLRAGNRRYAQFNYTTGR